MPQRIPERLAWAVEQLGLVGHERVLEIGGGTGVAAALVLDRLPTGYLHGIDRSAGAVAKASVRNAAAVAAGRAVFEVAALAGFRPTEPFDVALAINVNVFWTGTADGECAAVAAGLRPGGAVQLVFETPGPLDDNVLERSASNLAQHGFATTVVRGASTDLGAVIGCLGR